MRLLKATALAAFCLVWGFVGSLGAVWVMGDELEGDRGPRGLEGERGFAGEQGPPGEPAEDLSGGYVIGSVFGFGCPDGTTMTYSTSAVTADGDELTLCEIG